MKTARREQRIIGLLESRGEISVNELSEILDISVSTLRKQLAVMQQNGLLIRTYGGVMSVNRVPDESFESKLRKNVAEKRKIAERARALVPSGASIALGSGTTVYDLCNLLDDLDRGVIYSNSMHPHLQRHRPEPDRLHHRQRGCRILPEPETGGLRLYRLRRDQRKRRGDERQRLCRDGGAEHSLQREAPLYALRFLQNRPVGGGAHHEPEEL